MRFLTQPRSRPLWHACLSAVPSGEACCSTDANCADPSSARCGSAGCVDMPEWDVSLVTDMSELFRDKADFNADISAWDTSQVTNMEDMFMTPPRSTKTSDRGIPRRSRTWGTCSMTHSVQPRHRSWNTRRSRDGQFMAPRSTKTSALEYLAGDGQQYMLHPRHSTKISETGTSQVTNMQGMFAGARNFNGDLSRWDVGS